MTQAATIAIRACNMRDIIGHTAARNYAAKHGALGLYRLAVQLAAVTTVKGK